MIRSMTGYGEASRGTPFGKIRVQIRSLNHRFLDLVLRLPPGFMALEPRFREVIKGCIRRGRVDLYLKIERNEGASPLRARVDWGLARSYLEGMRELKERFDLRGEVDLPLLLSFREVLSPEEEELGEEELWREILPVLEEALRRLDESRKREGEALREDLLERLKVIGGHLQGIEERAPFVVEEYRRRLSSKVKELLDGELDEGRLAQEVTLFASRADITEEVVRIRSHLEQFRERLGEGGPVGKALDFLIQEMVREANTIASKSSDLPITRHVLAIKEEVEKLREQVQNIE